ncbi:MAG: HAMP domain-containing protein [Verrucomicrobia bacterium]|nr:HAMP domain-containing protein [Verrucomicrobiota bacterium]
MPSEPQKPAPEPILAVDPVDQAPRIPLTSLLRTRLIILVGLAIVPVAGLVCLRAWMDHQDSRQQVIESLNRFVSQAPKEHHRTLESARQLLSTVAQMERWRSPTNRPYNLAFLSNLLALHETYVDLGAVDSQGRVISSARGLQPGTVLSNASWFQKAQVEQGLCLGDIRPGGSVRRPMLEVAFPILDKTNGSFQGAIYGALDLGWIRSLPSDSTLPGYASIAAVDNQHRLVLQHPTPDQSSSASAYGASFGWDQAVWKISGDGIHERRDSAGIDRLYAFATLVGDENDPELRVAVSLPASAAFAAARQTLWLNMGLLLLATLCSCLLAWIGADRTFLRNIRPLLRVARELHQGNTAARTGLAHQGGELQQLAAAVDEMAESLEKRVAERQQTEGRLRSLNRDLEQRIAERTVELERSNRELEEFAYAASHDLQEPLRMISGHLQLLERRYKDQLGDDAREYIHFAVDGAQRMDQLILDLLAYSRVSTQSQPAVKVDLDESLALAQSNLTLRIQEANAHLTSERMPAAMGDKLQLALVFQNLIGNAIKFRKPGTSPRIEITCVPAPENPGAFWRVEVRDNGIGIDKEHFDRIFQIFQRLHTREEHPGTGIGLAICKRIVERHGGRIWVESTPGEVTSFFFTLPKASKDA